MLVKEDALGLFSNSAERPVVLARTRRAILMQGLLTLVVPPGVRVFGDVDFLGVLKPRVVDNGGERIDRQVNAFDRIQIACVDRGDASSQVLNKRFLSVAVRLDGASALRALIRAEWQ